MALRGHTPVEISPIGHSAQHPHRRSSPDREFAVDEVDDRTQEIQCRRDDGFGDLAMTIGQTNDAILFVQTERDGSSQADRGEKMSGYSPPVDSLDERGSVEEAVPTAWSERQA